MEQGQALAEGLLWGPAAGGSPWGRRHIPGGEGGGGGLEAGQRQWERRECWSNAGGAARSPLCFTHLHLGAVHFALTTDTRVPAKLLVLGMEILQVVMLQFIPASTGRAAF